MPEFDTIIIGEHYHNTEIVGKNGIIKTKELSKKNPLVQIIHVCGNVDVNEIKKYSLMIYPNNPKPFGYMTVSADYLGSKAAIELNIAGLKVGEIMARNRLKYDLTRAHKESTKNKLIDDFKNI